MNNVIEKLMSKYPNKTIFTSKEIKAAAVEIGENPRSAYTAVKYTNNVHRLIVDLITWRE